jgi:hypothetical protein
MDTSKIDPDYDCGDTDNKFENLPEQEQKKWKEYSEKVWAMAETQKKKSSNGMVGDK